MESADADDAGANNVVDDVDNNDVEVGVNDVSVDDGVGANDVNVSGVRRGFDDVRLLELGPKRPLRSILGMTEAIFLCICLFIYLFISLYLSLFVCLLLNCAKTLKISSVTTGAFDIYT